MLSRGDDFPIHQTPEPVAFAGTDRNFYDRYFFNGYTPDGSVFFALAFGVYPHLNILDAHFSIILDDTQYCLHASRHLNMERMILTVGPITIEVVEPLQTLNLRIATRDGIFANLTFDGRAFPIEEPRFTHRVGPRTLMDYTRLTQNGTWHGSYSIDGRKGVLPEGTVGTRDRSWGVRPIGAPDAQGFAPPVMPSFFWQWTPLNFGSDSVFFHVNADAQGRPWNTRAVRVADGGGPGDGSHTNDASIALDLAPGARVARAAALDLGALGARITLTPIRHFLMRGIGYVGSSWPHGAYRGELAVEREDIALAGLDLCAPPDSLGNLHVQALCRATRTRADGRVDHGIGVHEQLILGPYAPYDL